MNEINFKSVFFKFCNRNQVSYWNGAGFRAQMVPFNLIKKEHLI